MRALLLALVLLVPSLALAQDPPSTVLPPTYVPGRVPRPQAFVMLHRARVRFDRVDDTHHAVDQIVDSVTHAPF